MALYELRLTPAFNHLVFRPTPALTAQLVLSALPGARVQALAPLADGYQLAVEITRGDHSQTMDELTAAMHTLGFDVAEAAVTEFVDALAEGSAVGAAGGAALGGATRTGAGFVLLLLAGLLVGALAGSTRKAVHARYSVRRLNTGAWQFIRLDPPPTAHTQPI